MTPPEIPIVRVAGSLREVGRQIGAACAETIRRETAFEVQTIPAGRSRAEQLSLADRYREITRGAMPWVLDELDGCAEGSDVDPRALFACCVEEIWYERRAPAATARIDGRCSDLVAVPPSTARGRVLSAHNNDMSRRYMDDLVAIERSVDGEPTVFTIGNGIWISTGWNSAGLNLTGNELSPNDERIGIPREIQVRAMLRERSLGAMVSAALHPSRASSYNNVLVNHRGGVANVEGSATDAVVHGADDRGHLAHTNHYVCDAMLGYEGDPDYAERSAIRLNRAHELLEGTPDGTVDAALLRTFLSDHEHAPDSICRHETPGRSSFTCFWCIADLTDGTVSFGRGNPCESLTQTYAFAVWPAAQTATS